MPDDLVIVCALAAELELEDVLPGSRVLTCATCNRAVTMAPSSQAMANGADRPVYPLCPDCALELLSQPDDVVRVRPLTPSQMEQMATEAVEEIGRQQRRWWQRLNRWRWL